jgi:hypothetical protein
MKSEHKSTSENARQKNMQEKKFSELTAEKAKIEKITIRTDLTTVSKSISVV